MYVSKQVRNSDFMYVCNTQLFIALDPNEVHKIHPYHKVYYQNCKENIRKVKKTFLGLEVMFSRSKITTWPTTVTKEDQRPIAAEKEVDNNGIDQHHQTFHLR